MPILVPGAFWQIFITKNGVKIWENAAIFHCPEPVFWLLSHFWPPKWARKVTKPQQSIWQIVSRFARSRRIQNRADWWDFTAQNARRFFLFSGSFLLRVHFWPSESVRSVTKPYNNSLQVYWKFTMTSWIQNMATWPYFLAKHARWLFSVFRPFSTSVAFLALRKCPKSQ